MKDHVRPPRIARQPPNNTAIRSERNQVVHAVRSEMTPYTMQTLDPRIDVETRTLSAPLRCANSRMTLAGEWMIVPGVQSKCQCPVGVTPCSCTVHIIFDCRTWPQRWQGWFTATNRLLLGICTCTAATVSATVLTALPSYTSSGITWTVLTSRRVLERGPKVPIEYNKSGFPAFELTDLHRWPSIDWI